MQKSVSLNMSSLGSRVPTQAGTCPTAQMYCSTWIFFTGFILCASSLVRTQCAKNGEKGQDRGCIREIGIKPEAFAVLFPLGPVGAVQLFITRRDSGLYCCPDSTLVSAHLSANVRGACCHKLCCRYLELKKATRLLGVGWRMRKASSTS